MSYRDTYALSRKLVSQSHGEAGDSTLRRRIYAESRNEGYPFGSQTIDMNHDGIFDRRLAHYAYSLARTKTKSQDVHLEHGLPILQSTVYKARRTKIILDNVFGILHRSLRKCVCISFKK